MAIAGYIGSSEALHVIVTCTNRKTRVVPERLHLGSVPGSDTANAHVNGSAGSARSFAADRGAGSLCRRTLADRP